MHFKFKTMHKPGVTYTSTLGEGIYVQAENVLDALKKARKKAEALKVDIDESSVFIIKEVNDEPR